MSNQPALQHTYLPHPADGLREKPRRGFWKTVLRIIAWGMYVLSVPVCLIVTGVVIVGLVLLGGSIDNVILHFCGHAGDAFCGSGPWLCWAVFLWCEDHWWSFHVFAG